MLKSEATGVTQVVPEREALERAFRNGVSHERLTWAEAARQTEEPTGGVIGPSKAEQVAEWITNHDARVVSKWKKRCNAQRRELRRLNAMLAQYAGVLRGRIRTFNAEEVARLRHDMDKYRKRAQEAEGRCQRLEASLERCGQILEKA